MVSRCHCFDVRKLQAHEEPGRGVVPQRYFTAIDPKYARSTAGGGSGRNNWVSRKKTQFHQAARDIVGKIQTVQYAFFPIT
jgi:hypothetical protein